jgi:hypothetical protein
MNPEKQKQIAESFSEKFEWFDPGLGIPATEFDLFSKGIFSTSMDEKWNIFVYDDHMYMARSWTDHCIFKVHFIRGSGFVTLTRVFVTRDQAQYKSTDIEQDRIYFLGIIQAFLERDYNTTRPK